MSADLEHIRQIMREADCLYTEAQVEEAIAKVGAHISREMADTNPVVFCVMNGGLIFAGKLLTHLQFPLEASYLHATRYRSETSGGELFWKAKPEISFMDRDVLIIDDILDEGHTLGALIDFGVFFWLQILTALAMVMLGDGAEGALDVADMRRIKMSAWRRRRRSRLGCGVGTVERISHGALANLGAKHNELDLNGASPIRPWTRR